MNAAPTLILWIQFSYAIWSFVRVAKLFRIPYGVFNSLLACVYFLFKNNSRIILPFQRVTYTQLSAPTSRDAFFVSSLQFEAIGFDINAIAQRGDIVSATSIENEDAESESTRSSQSEAMESGASSFREETENSGFQLSDLTELPNAMFGYIKLPTGLPSYIWNSLQRNYEKRLELRKCKLRLNGEDYIFLLKGKETFLVDICRDAPVVFCMKSDMIFPGWSIVEPMNHVDALNKIICEGYHPLPARHERILPIWLLEDELNRNFIRILSTLPLVAQAEGRKQLSHYVFFAVLVIDQLGFVFEIIHQRAKHLIVHLFKSFVSKYISSPTVRIAVCKFFSSFDEEFDLSDKYCHNFVRIMKGQEFLVCNTRACQVGGEMGDYIRDHEPIRSEVRNSSFIDVCLRLEAGYLQEFQSSKWSLYEIGHCQLYINESEGGDSGLIHVFCSQICVHSGYIDRACIHYMLNALKLVAEQGHLPVYSVSHNSAHSIPINNFISDPLYFLSIHIFRASKNIWIGK